MFMRQRKGLELNEAKRRWRKIPTGEYHKAESYLGAREKFCVTACSRFLRLKENRGHVWYLPDGGNEISAILLHSRRSLFPVFCGQKHIPHPRFLSRFLGKVSIHAIQGLKEDAELLESLMTEQGYFASERIDYELMGLEVEPKNKTLKPGPPGLVFRPPRQEDEEELFALQSAYEQEEVLPKNSTFNPAASRLNLRHILSRESVLVAELDGRAVGKINTNAESFTRTQIGGVYVHPDYRCQGIGAKMAMAFAHDLLKRGKALTLFVKNRNLAALKVYRNIGFNFIADYRITYY